MKNDFSQIFEDPRKFEKENEKGIDWKVFNKEGRDANLIIENPQNTPSFEDAMFTDIVRSLRKDAKAQIEKKGSKK